MVSTDVIIVIHRDAETPADPLYVPAFHIHRNDILRLACIGHLVSIYLYPNTANTIESILESWV